MPFILLGVFLFWMFPEIYSNHLDDGSTASKIIVQHRFFGILTGATEYRHDEIESIAIQYHRAYFDFKMRGIYRIGFRLRDGGFVILKQLNTTPQNELSLIYSSDMMIKHNQALEFAKKFAAQLQLGIKDESVESAPEMGHLPAGKG